MSMSTFTPVEMLRNGQHRLTDVAVQFITGFPYPGPSLRPLTTATRKEHIGKEASP